jgi:hypothetical protein
MLCGIPQGFILRHISCLRYIYDVTNIWNKIKVILFADDNNVLYAGKSITQVNNVLNNELKQMIQWFKVNKLSLNINTKITCVSITSLIRMIVNSRLID